MQSHNKLTQEQMHKAFIKFFSWINIIIILSLLGIKMMDKTLFYVWDVGICITSSIVFIVILKNRLNRGEERSNRLVEIIILMVTSVNIFFLAQKIFMLNAVPSNYFRIFLFITSIVYLILIISAFLTKGSKNKHMPFIPYLIGGIIMVGICGGSEYISKLYFNNSDLLLFSIIVWVFSCLFGYLGAFNYKKYRTEGKQVQWNSLRK